MSKNKSTPTNFVATVYGELVPLKNAALSKARLKIFYKGMNRNGTYITDEIAEHLISTLPGTPVVGYYDGDKDDFVGHVEKEHSHAYGFVPENLNFSWEMSLDPDGVYRTYACTDVILWTGRYPIASKIVGKSHSMELNPDTIEGKWAEHDDEFCFEFTNAEFIGLCVLGAEYEPCFEGSSFYELHKDNEGDLGIKTELKEMYSLYSQMENIADENPTGGQKMNDEENKELELNEEVVNDQAEEVQVEEVVENEKENENVEEKHEVEEEVEEEKTPTEEQPVEDNKENEEPVAEEVNEEVESSEESADAEVDFTAQLAEKDAEIANLKAEIAQLQSYQAQKISEEKEAVLNSYSNKLSEEEVNEFKAKLDSYQSAVDLKKDIALCILDKESEEEVEADDKSQYTMAKSQKEQLTGAAAIIARHVK